MGDIEAKDKKTKKRLFSSWWLSLFIGVIIGAGVLVAARFATFKSDEVHYHANFALYVNGKQDEFKNPTFYEEVQTCDVHDKNDVHGRAHMHNQNGHLVHVHANAVTWGQFFANLGYTLGNSVIKTDGGVYVDSQGGKLTFILNGSKETDIANRVIKSEDVLLIDYGNDSDNTLQQRYKDIPRDAHQANVKADPAACSGPEKTNFSTRLKHAIGINDSGH